MMNLKTKKPVKQNELKGKPIGDILYMEEYGSLYLLTESELNIYSTYSLESQINSKYPKMTNFSYNKENLIIKESDEQPVKFESLKFSGMTKDKRYVYFSCFGKNEDKSENNAIVRLNSSDEGDYKCYVNEDSKSEVTSPILKDKYAFFSEKNGKVYKVLKSSMIGVTAASDSSAGEIQSPPVFDQMNLYYIQGDKANGYVLIIRDLENLNKIKEIKLSGIPCTYWKKENNSYLSIDIDLDVYEKPLYIKDNNIYIPLVTSIRKQNNMPKGFELAGGFSTENSLIIELNSGNQNISFCENGENYTYITTSLFYNKDIKTKEYLAIKTIRVLENDNLHREELSLNFQLINRKSLKTIFYETTSLDSLNFNGLIVISKDNNFLYISRKNYVEIIDLRKNKLIKKLDIEIYNGDSFNNSPKFIVTEDNKFIYASTLKGLLVFDIEKNIEIKTIPMFSLINSLVFSPKKNCIYFTTNDEVYCFDIKTEITSAFSTKSFVENIFNIYKIKSYSTLKFQSISNYSDENLIYIAGWGVNLIINVNSKVIESAIVTDTFKAKISLNSKYLGSAVNGCFLVCSEKNWQKRILLSDSLTYPKDFVFSSDSKYIYLLTGKGSEINESGKIRVYDVETGKFIKSFDGNFTNIEAVPVFNDDVLIVANDTLEITKNKITVEFCNLFTQTFQNITSEKAFFKFSKSSIEISKDTKEECNIYYGSKIYKGTLNLNTDNPSFELVETYDLGEYSIVSEPIIAEDDNGTIYTYIACKNDNEKYYVNVYDNI